jgi:NTP pyrophosphatase (non-canonical NTP hydrolase)
MDSGSIIRDHQKIVHGWAVRKQWRGPDAETQRTVGDDIALFHSEASEALEAFRECADPTKVWYSYDVMYEGVKFKNLTAEQVEILTGLTPEQIGLTPKPEGVPSELADIYIRLVDFCENYGIDLTDHIHEKLAHNETRELRHGGKHL